MPWCFCRKNECDIPIRVPERFPISNDCVEIDGAETSKFDERRTFGQFRGDCPTINSVKLLPEIHFGYLLCQLGLQPVPAGCPLVQNLAMQGRFFETRSL